MRSLTYLSHTQVMVAADNDQQQQQQKARLSSRGTYVLLRSGIKISSTNCLKYGTCAASCGNFGCVLSKGCSLLLLQFHLDAGVANDGQYVMDRRVACAEQLRWSSCLYSRCRDVV